MFTSRTFRDYVSLYNQLDLEDPYLCICVFNCSCVKRHQCWLKIDLKNQVVFISIQKKEFFNIIMLVPLLRNLKSESCNFLLFFNV